VKKQLGHGEGARAFSEAMDRHRAGDYEASSEGFRLAHEEGHAKGTSAFNVACALARLGREREAIDWLERAFDDGFPQYDLLDTDEDLAFIRDSRRFADFRDSVQGRADERERLDIEKRQRKLEGKLNDLREPGFDEGAKAYRLGYEMHEIENWEGAEEAWRRAAELGHSPANSHYNVACALARQGHDSEALDWLERAVALGFDDASNLKRDDDLASLRGRARFQELIETSGALKMPGDINDLDEIRENQAEWRAFTERTGELTRRHPDMGKAWMQHGMGLLRTARYDEAAAAFRRAAELDQPEGLCLWNEACALAAAGRRDEAVETLSRALESGFGSGWQLANDPDLASLAGHAGFERLKAEHPPRGDEKSIMKWLKMSRQGERQVY
jgi:tetratricopeptide (TPR) repeat protein